MSNKRKTFSVLFILFIIVSLFIAVQPASAVTYLFEGIGCLKNGDCSLQDFLQVFINAGQWILGVSGSFALLMFIIGGLMWIFSGGNEQRVTRGKQIITGTVIGIALVLGSWLLVNFVGKLLGRELLVTGGPCAMAADGQSPTGCNDHQVCYNRQCLSKCEHAVKTGAFPNGYACFDKSLCDGNSIKEGYCPGGKDNVCCQLKTD